MYYNKEHEEKVNNREDGYIYIGSYHSKEYTIDGKYSKSLSYIRVKCPYCGKEYDITLNAFINKKCKCKKCCNEYRNSFAYHIQVELQEPLNKYWDWENNTVNPYLISKSSMNKINIKCDKKDYHFNYITTCDRFYKGSRCPYCTSKKVHQRDSFGQWLIDEFGNDAIEKYWSPKNTLNPFKISKYNKKSIWILCQDKDYHNHNGGYKTTPYLFYIGRRCPYCSHTGSEIHPKDSFGMLYPDKVKYWSLNNNKSPYEISPYSGKKYKFICEKCGEEFERTLNNLNQNDTGVICISCNSSELEYKTKKVLDKCNIKYETQVTYEDLIGLKGGLLSYDFYLPDYNILLECQGRQHEKYIKGLHESKKDFLKQLEHDRRKFEYAMKNNYIPMEIWYWDIDNIEEILIRELGLS